MVNTWSTEPITNHYSLLSQCKQVFYSEVPSRAGWSFVVRYDLRERPIKYNVVEDYDIEEEYDVEE